MPAWGGDRQRETLGGLPGTPQPTATRCPVPAPPLPASPGVSPSFSLAPSEETSSLRDCGGDFRGLELAAREVELLMSDLSVISKAPN